MSVANEDCIEGVVRCDLRTHNERKDKWGESTWYIRTPRRRKIGIQSYKGRLYLMGSLWLRRKGTPFPDVLLPRECTIGYIRRKYGEPTIT